ncbi:hypothetical protein BCU68_13195 [Vibrio sp. 10N.286.49.B3]|uniref:efflux RND transporter periplasmic adaptor subunit n=1 Tax=Vibrio sp. 10N.286.49.B3 TaxID=1880855 RepID=UPI000C825813|nr:efflux RND transporter periplasmic adaptor subunit [Vibrio sp. 10N.286.49.B3]PMH43798.1 hypothetical protein BCU68_13195 [Vibrio sp. 10N.286.49.B3]
MRPSLSFKLRYFIAISVTAIAISAFIFIPRTSAEQTSQEVEKTPSYARAVKLMQVDNLSSHFTRTFPAKVVASQQVDLAFRVNGQLTHLDLLAGQQVKKGDLLAQLDNRDATNNLLNAQANHQLATADFSRKKELLARKLISKSDFDTAEAQLQSTLATLNAAKDQLSYTQLIAPFSGIVAKVDLENHQMLQASQVVMTLQTNKKFDLTFNVPESYLFNNKENINANQAEYSVKFHGSDDTFPVTFKEMNTVVNNGSQTYQMTLSFTPATHFNLSILPGMSADVVVHEKHASQPLPVLPLSAIGHDEQTEQDFVWIYQPQTQTLTKSIVQLGKIRTQGSEIISGINEGDQIVAIGASSIHSDTKVTPLRWERGI